MWSPGAARPGAARQASSPSSRRRAPGEWGVVVGAGGRAGGLVASGVQQFGLVFRAWLHFIFAGVRSSLLRSGRALRFFLPDLGVVDAWAGRPRTSRSLGVAHSSLAPRAQASVWPLAGCSDATECRCTHLLFCLDLALLPFVRPLSLSWRRCSAGTPVL